MADLCSDRVVAITGAGRGIGRGHALEFARQGAKVVVNDLGAAVDGSGNSSGPAQDVVEKIHAMGGEAAANTDDVSSWQGAERLLETALDNFGRLDVLVNNAGILRDRMLFNMTEQEWDDVIRVHMKGTFCPLRIAAGHWRGQAKAEGRPQQARIINTTSVSGLFGNPGQLNYGAAKAGIAAMTLIAAKELARYGVTVNAVSPGARTRMTADPNAQREPQEGFDVSDPANIAPVVVWLGSLDSEEVSGRVFEIYGGKLSVTEGWTVGPQVDLGRRWDPQAIGEVMLDLHQRAAVPQEAQM